MYCFFFATLIHFDKNISRFNPTSSFITPFEFYNYKRDGSGTFYNIFIFNDAEKLRILGVNENTVRFLKFIFPANLVLCILLTLALLNIALSIMFTGCLIKGRVHRWFICTMSIAVVQYIAMFPIWYFMNTVLPTSRENVTGG